MTKFADLCQRIVALGFLLGASSFVLTAHAQTLVVGSLVSGQVMQVLHSEGSQVKKGDLILVIDDRDYQARLGMLAAERDRAAAIFADAEIEMANIEDLFDRTVIAKRPYQQAQRDFAVAKANLAIAEAKLTAHQAWLSYYHVRAPQQGRIIQLTVSAGSTVFQENQPLFELEIGVE